MDHGLVKNKVIRNLLSDPMKPSMLAANRGKPISLAVEVEENDRVQIWELWCESMRKKITHYLADY